MLHPTDAPQHDEGGHKDIKRDLADIRKRMESFQEYFQTHLHLLKTEMNSYKEWYEKENLLGSPGHYHA